MGGQPVAHAQANATLPIVGHMTTYHVSDNLNTDKGDAPGSLLLLDSAHRRGYGVAAWTSTDAAGLSNYETEITVYNLDTLAVLSRHEIDGVWPLSQVTGGNDGAPAFGFVATLVTGLSSPRLVFAVGITSLPTVQPEDLLTVDLSSFTITSDLALGSTVACATGGNGAPGPCPVEGLSYDARSHLVYALAMQSDFELAIQKVGPETFAAYAVDPATSSVKGSATLPASCNAPLRGNGAGHAYQDPVFRSNDGSSLWTICGLSTAALVTPVLAAVQLPVNAAGVPQASPANVYPTGLTTVTDAYGDPGTDRISFDVTLSADRFLLVFDGRHASYVGTVGLNPHAAVGGYSAALTSATGIDPVTGRVYSFSLSGAYLADTRRTDVLGFPQAAVFPNSQSGEFGMGGSVAVDPVTHHVFARLVTESQDAQAIHADAYYTVYQDNLPFSQDVPLSSLDVNTANVASVPGSTVSIYAGHAQGFGSRSYQLHASEVPDTSVANPAPNSDVIEATAGSVAGGGGADLSASSAAASGGTLDADDHTRQTYTANTKQQFPYAQHACDDSSGTATTASSTNDAGGSTVESCDLTKGVTSVTSAYRASDTAPGGLPATSPSESDVSATVSYAVCPAAPVCNGVGSGPSAISTATSTVHGIDLAAAVSISYLQITATAVAGGRSGTAVTRYATTIRGVHAGAYDCAANCDPTTALQQINSALAQQLPGQVIVVMPGADPTAAAGTPHGYYAAVIKDTYQLLNDQTLYGDTRPELVGLEEIRNGTATTGGITDIQITDYAGVEVESRFGITALDLSNPTFGTGAITAGTSTAGSAGSAGQFVPGSNAGGSGSPGAGAAGGSRNNGTGPLGALVNGLAWLLDWTQLPLMSLMWIVLLLPAYLATRRQRLGVLAL